LARIVETCFPYREVSELVRRERRNLKPYQLIHPWPGRMPGVLFRALILASILDEEDLGLFWQLLRHRGRSRVGRGLTFLDPFAGSGTSLVEASSLGMSVVGADVNAVAWLVSRATLLWEPPRRIIEAANYVVERVKPLALRLYSTRAPDGERVVARAFFWVRTVVCERCGSPVRLFKTYKLARSGGRAWVYCPSCHTVFRAEEEAATCPSCGEAPKPTGRGRYYVCPTCGYVGLITSSVRSFGKPGMELFAVMYSSQGNVWVKAAEREDLEVYSKAVSLAARVPSGFLDLALRRGEETSRILRYGYLNFRELFNARQLVMLYALARAIRGVRGRAAEFLALALSKTLGFATVLTPYSYVCGKPESALALHQFTFEKMYMEINILERIRGSFVNNVLNVVKAKEYTSSILGRSVHATVLKLDSRRLELPPSSVDLVVTDPPHFGNVINSGLADLHYALLKAVVGHRYAELSGERSCDDESEIVWDPVRGKGFEEFVRGLIQVFSKVRRALKPEGVMVVLFRHWREEAWDALRESLKEAGFSVTREWPLDLEGYPQPQAKAVKAKVRSAALVCEGT